MAALRRHRSAYSFLPFDAMSDITVHDSEEDYSEEDGEEDDAGPTNKEELIESICVAVGKEDGGRRRPLRVVIIGKCGAGKSSFINSIATAFSGTWHEYSSSGTSGEVYTYTVHALRYPKCCLDNDSRYSDVLLPTLIDVPGLSEYADEHVEELLRFLLYGHIMEDSAFLAVYEDIKKMDKREVREKYSHVYNDMKVDRVVFVASAENGIPEKLLRCVFRVARPPYHRDSIRTVPIFGVLTKMDKLDTTTTSFREKQEEFMKLLGLNATRFLLCKNYCDDTDTNHGGRHRGGSDEIDLPILEFMERLCDPALRVIRGDELLSGTKPLPNPSASPTTSQTDSPFIVWLRKRKQALYVFYARKQVSLPHWFITPLIGFFLTIFLIFLMLRWLDEGRPVMTRSIAASFVPEAMFIDPLSTYSAFCISTYSAFGMTCVLSLIIAFLIYVCCEAL